MGTIGTHGIVETDRPRGGTARRRALGRPTGAALAALVARGSLGDARAARYGVRVVDAAGLPVAGASVCIGLDGDFERYGTAFTDADGRIRLVDVPRVPLVVTVSKSRFSGARLTEPARRYDVVRELELASDGRPGPRCRAVRTLAGDPPYIELRGADVERRGGTTTLRPRGSGRAVEYRVAREEAWLGNDWRTLDGPIALPAALAGAPAVALQLRRRVGGRDGWIEGLSNVVTVELGSGGDGTDG